MRIRRSLTGGLCLVALFVMGCQPPPAPNAGEPHPGSVPQANPKQPLSGFTVHLDGFHTMKEDPSHMLEAHHYCRQSTPELAECVLFDGDGDRAHMTGVEYIVSERLFETLPAAERPYWHPHNYEILSGQLVIPGVPPSAEKQALARKMNSYGKTWHTWRAGAATTPGDAIPMGSPELGWSINADGELPQGLLDARDSHLRISTKERRDARADMIFTAHPQEGVDALAKSFPGRRPVPGVADKSADPAP